jgi:effector-binding domain-containing protein
MPEFKLITVAETPYLYVERTCSWNPQDIAAATGSALQEVWAFMQANAIRPAGGALSVYYSYSPDQVTFRAGFTVAAGDMAKAAGGVKAGATPTGRAVHFTHKGSYATLRDDYDAMMKWMKEKGMEMGAPTWEVYMNAPDQVPEEELLTEVYVALA